MIFPASFPDRGRRLPDGRRHRPGLPATTPSSSAWLPPVSRRSSATRPSFSASRRHRSAYHFRAGHHPASARIMGLLWPVASCCSGSAGRCGASCAPTARPSSMRRRSSRGSGHRSGRHHWPGVRARPSPRPPGRSSSPTCRCRSTTCWRWQGGARAPLYPGLRPPAVDRPHGHCGLVHRPPAPALPLDRLCGSGDHPLRVAQDDLRGLGRGCTPRRSVGG